jgi:hypothetical protein
LVSFKKYSGTCCIAINTEIFLKLLFSLSRIIIQYLCVEKQYLRIFFLTEVIMIFNIIWYISGLYSTFMAFLVFTGILVLVANISVSFGKCFNESYFRCNLNMNSCLWMFFFYLFFYLFFFKLKILITLSQTFKGTLCPRNH